MKLDLIGNQYKQMAKEKFCILMKQIPFVSDIEIIPIGLQRGFGDFHAMVHFDDGREQRFCIEVKSNGEKRFVNYFLLMASQHHDNSCYVFMAPYISEASSEAIREKKYSYIDLSGNCYILTRQIFLHISGKPNQYIDKREKKNYFSKSSAAASAILRTILYKPHAYWRVKTLAGITGKAIGMVSNVKAFLKDRDWIEEYSDGFVVRDVRELLYTWAKDYHKKDARALEFYSLDSISELEQKIARWTNTHDKSALLGNFSAAARYAPTVRYNKVDVYVEPQAFDEFVKDMDLQPVNFGGNVIITIPHDETPCMFYREINGDYVTSPVQTILDLLGNVGRGEEAAQAIIAKEYKE